MPETVMCRLECGRPAMESTIGARRQGGWYDLCAECHAEKGQRQADAKRRAREARCEADGGHDWETSLGGETGIARVCLTCSAVRTLAWAPCADFEKEIPHDGHPAPDGHGWCAGWLEEDEPEEPLPVCEPDCVLPSGQAGPRHEGPCITPRAQALERRPVLPEIGAGLRDPSHPLYPPAPPTIDERFAEVWHAVSDLETGRLPGRLVGAWAEAVEALYAQISVDAADPDKIERLIGLTGTLLAQGRDEIPPALAAAVPSAA